MALPLGKIASHQFEGTHWRLNYATIIWRKDKVAGRLGETLFQFSSHIFSGRSPIRLSPAIHHRHFEEEAAKIVCDDALGGASGCGRGSTQ